MSRDGRSISSMSSSLPRGSISQDEHLLHAAQYSQSIEDHTSPLAITSRMSSLHHNHDPFSQNAEAWNTEVSYSASLDAQPLLEPLLPFTTHPTQDPIVTSSWSPQEVIQTASWNDATLTNNFISPSTESTLVEWEAVTSPTTSWPHIEPSTTETLTPTTSGGTAPYRQQSFWAYKRQEAASPPTYADMEMTAEIPYPSLYSPTTQLMATPIHPAFDTNVADVEALRQAVSDVSDSHDLLLDSSCAREAIVSAKSRTNSKTSISSSHSHSHGSITKSKQAPKGGRVGPLTVTQREKVEDMRSYGACWRCRKYKKPCNGPGVCNTCITSGFRVWPSALGCRRGDFDSFAFGMIPTHAEQIVGQIVATYPKPVGWRKLAKFYRSELTVPQSYSNGDEFARLMLKVQTTQLTGPGVMELLQIACNLQRGLVKKSRVLANTLKGLGHACEFYSCFVATEESPSILRSRWDMVNIFTQNRKALLTTLSSFLNSCLTGRMKDWLPTFLSANFIIFTFVMLSDAAVMVPLHFREKLWASIRAIIMDFRGILYPMAQDLLSALGKGSKLLHMQCWNMVEKPSEDPDEESTWERNREGMKILDEDTAIFDGLRALQLWLEKFGPLMRGDVWYSSAPHTVDVLPICSWERMFDFSPRG